MLNIGQKVVCVNDKPPPRPYLWTKSYLKRGRIYTIRETGLITAGGSCGVKLVGIKLGPRDDPFGQIRFRPVVERKTDISVFKKMLLPAPIVEEVD